VARLNVYIPDELAAQLRQHREAINVSSVLQEALQARLALLSDADMARLRDAQAAATSAVKSLEASGALETTRRVIESIEAGGGLESSRQALRAFEASGGLARLEELHQTLAQSGVLEAAERWTRVQRELAALQAEQARQARYLRQLGFDGDDGDEVRGDAP
jgi:post-segregation antitoxin (ccd killing protein)